MRPAQPEFDEEHLRLVTDKLSAKADKLTRANERLTALVDLGLDLASERDVPRLLQSFCHRAREIVGARVAVVCILNDNTQQALHLAVSGLDAEAEARLRSGQPRHGFLHAILKQRTCLRLPAGDDEAADPGLPDSFPPCDAALGAPMVSPSRVYGWLCLLDKLAADQFSAEDERVAGIVAAQVGRLYEYGSLFASLAHHAADLEREVTERQRAEQSLRESEETLRLTQRQLQQAQKMEAIGRLAGGVAHDFNNLLTVINGYGELLLSRMADGDPMRTLIREMVTAGDRAAILTRQLLAFSRKTILEPRVLDLTAVVADVEKMLRRIVGEDVQLSTVAGQDVGAIKADLSHIEQVLMNLVVNARDAMPQGGRLTIAVKNADLDEPYVSAHPGTHLGPHVLLAVTDTGCGMDAATLAHIFEPFFTTKGERGTGLGLATVHGIVEQSGGHVTVDSAVGQGTTVRVYLPHCAARPAPAKANAHLAAMPRGSETVLLVEDEEGVRALCRHVLSSCGYTVMEARDGAEALRVAGAHAPRLDLLVTDVVLPRMGGREIAERVSALHSEVKVLYLSGYTSDAVVRHGIQQAEVAFLQKPFTPATLAAKVRDVLDCA
jgi:signal transduction histidine kinase